MSERPKLLYLDDEENNLFAMKALLRRDYDVFTTTSAQDAVRYLNENEVPVILSDQKMPEISGVEFFELTIPNFPNAVRILVTGYADMEAVIDAINKGNVYRYVSKPWDEQELKITIDNALDKYNREKELQQRTSELEKVNAELERFIYSASHDLRAPLVSMKGIAKLARMEDLGEKSDEYFGMMERSVDRMDELVQNIIHFYQNNKSDEIITDIDFDQLVDTVIEQYKNFDGTKSVVCTKSISTSGGFKADAHRLKMILGHLVSNAIKYNDPEKLARTVEVEVIQNMEKAIVHVRDNGVGIDGELLPRVFDMFSRNSDMNLGAGIGLYIAREAVLRMGGKIEVHSTPEVGTRFTFEIPNKA
jgi:signal transduction histidine kinase